MVNIIVIFLTWLEEMLCASFARSISGFMSPSVQSCNTIKGMPRFLWRGKDPRVSSVSLSWRQVLHADVVKDVFFWLHWHWFSWHTCGYRNNSLDKSPPLLWEGYEHGSSTGNINKELALPMHVIKGWKQKLAMWLSKPCVINSISLHNLFGQCEAMGTFRKSDSKSVQIWGTLSYGTTHYVALYNFTVLELVMKMPPPLGFIYWAVQDTTSNKTENLAAVKALTSTTHWSDCVLIHSESLL